MKRLMIVVTSLHAAVVVLWLLWARGIHSNELGPPTLIIFWLIDYPSAILVATICPGAFDFLGGAGLWPALIGLWIAGTVQWNLIAWLWHLAMRCRLAK